MDTLEALRIDVEAFLAEREMKPTRFGMDALGDPRFVHDLKRGREPRSKTAAKVREFMAKARSEHTGSAA